MSSNPETISLDFLFHPPRAALDVRQRSGYAPGWPVTLHPAGLIEREEQSEGAP